MYSCLDCFVNSRVHSVSHPRVGCWYSDVTSMEASRQLWGRFVVSISFRNSVESFRYEKRFFTCGCNHRSTNWDMGSVMLLV